MADRFHAPGSWAGSVLLDEAEARHLSRVLRKRTGDVVEIFNGRGDAARCVVSTIGKRDVELTVTELLPPEIQPLPRITLAAAPPKGERLRWLIEKGTELGVDRLIPLRTARSIVDPGEQKIAKLEQTSIAACKQSGRNRLPRIDEVTSLDRLTDSLDPGTRLLVGSPEGAPLFEELCRPRGVTAEVVAVIGPEGGLTEDEVALLVSSGAVAVSIAPHVLRIETAAIALVAALVAHRHSSTSPRGA